MKNHSRTVSFTIARMCILKYIFYTFLYLNIYTIFSSVGYAQQLQLEIETQPSLTDGLKDSLNIQKSI